MRRGRLPIAFAALLSVPAGAEDAHLSQTCLTQAEMREVVAQKKVVAPLAALRAARASEGGGKVIRASLCRHDNEFVYHVTTLHRDGRVLRVKIEGRSGKVEPGR